MPSGVLVAVTTDTGTGAITLGSIVTRFRTSFTSLVVEYSIASSTEWEVGLGTMTTTTLSRTVVLASSNAGALVNFAAGTKNVWAMVTDKDSI